MLLIRMICRLICMHFKIYRLEQGNTQMYNYACENMICDGTTEKTLFKIICLPEIGDL